MTDQLAVEFIPPPDGYYTSYLTSIKDTMIQDLMPHVNEWHAIVCAGDFHGMALGAIAAAMLGKPLALVCTHQHEEVVSHIVILGEQEFDPDGPLLYLDDMFTLGASLANTMAYLSQSRPANIVATYEAMKRRYTPGKPAVAES